MLPAPPPVASESQPANAPLENTILGFCREVAKGMDPSESNDRPVRAKALQAQATALSEVAQSGLPPESRARPLLEAALGALECLCEAENPAAAMQGERRYGLAAKALAQRWRERQLALALDSPKRVPEWEGVALLYELGGLSGRRWQDEALRLRVRLFLAQGSNRDSSLGKDVAAAVEYHYGPWLTVANVEPMLEFSGFLLRVWGSEKEASKLTQQVATLALKQDAERVWRLAARKGAADLREEMALLLDRLDAGILLKDHAEPTLKLSGALLDTALEPAVRRLLKRLDGAAQKSQTHQATRRRIAHLVGDRETEATLLAEALAHGGSGRPGLELLREAADLLAGRPHARLLAEATRQLRIAVGEGHRFKDEGWGFPEALIAFADLHQASGQIDEAEALLRLRLEWEDSQHQLQGRFQLLARLSRWSELKEQLGPPLADGLERLGWRYRCAQGLGQKEEALAWARAWIDAALQLPPHEGPPSLPGLSLARASLSADLEKLTALADRFGAQAAPGLERMWLDDPTWMLVALDPEATENPTGTEANLRWRMQHLPADSAAALKVLESLQQEAERRLGEDHLLIAELLMARARHEKEAGLPLLERAQSLVEKHQAPEGDNSGSASREKARLLMAVYEHLATAHASEGDARGLEDDLRGLLDILEGEEAPSREAVQGLALLWLHFWRQQRMDDLLDTATRLERLKARMRNPPKDGSAPGAAESSQLPEPDELAPFKRSARFQAQLRAAGWP
jgi:hypothetical protein